jgi:UDP-glucose 4-epimerase
MTPQKWLITGGAGYIGAHVADAFLSSGKEVIVYDSLYQGLESRIQYLCKKYNKEIPFIVADIRDAARFDNVLDTYKPIGIVHSAALKSVEESTKRPEEYFEVNFHATKSILGMAKKHNIKRFIFSSTAAVYGAPVHLNPVKEDDPKNPISPYGASKLEAEHEVSEFLKTAGNSGTSLRFFNVVGNTDPALSDNSVENLVPIVINKLESGLTPVIHGADYPTPDGTCIRDYVDVRDIARAHLTVADAVGFLPSAMNVGTGQGASVREIIQLVVDAVGSSQISVIEGPRRVGDPAFLCADVTLIKDTIGFSSRYSIKESTKSLF